MLVIDGSVGEGGGQILRSSLALSMASGRPVRIEKIRAGRSKPGLMRQHLTAVHAARAVANAEVEGAEVGSTRLTFRPGQVQAGDFRFAIGTAGSTTLVLQTILPALIVGERASTIKLEGGTHNPAAPPFEFLASTFLPLLGQLGPSFEVNLERTGFFPAGGGAIAVKVEPVRHLLPLEINGCAGPGELSARIQLARLPRAIAEREAEVLAARTDLETSAIVIDSIDSPGPGNVVQLRWRRTLTTTIGEIEHIEIFTAFGEKGRSSETVAGDAVLQFRCHRKADVPIGEQLADQLILPMALAPGRSSFVTRPLSRHASTQVELVRRFTERRIIVEEVGPDKVRIEIG
jgi:RNA 3'-terminal phosphate cyclase (ATP)